MCTVSFLPLPLPSGGYLLATNRDESPVRGEALPPAWILAGGRRVLAPVDPDAGGSWVALDEDGRALCVLNGDRPAAAPPPVEPRSRGLLLLDLMADPRPASVWRALDAGQDALRRAARPFKLLAVEPGPPASGLFMEWDGARLRRTPIAGDACLVSSSFEPDEVGRRRVQAFRELAARPRRDVADLAAAQIAWHRSHAAGAATGDAFSVCMHRREASSRSLTALEVWADERAMSYVAGPPCAGAPALRRSFSEPRPAVAPPARRGAGR